MKFIRTGILTAIMCVLCTFTAFSAQGTISFSDPTVNVGDEVNVSMKITADEGTALSKANVVLTYPSGNLEFVSGTDAEGGAGAIRVHGTTNGGGTALLEYNLKFKTSNAGTFSIGIDSYEVYDADDNPIEFTHLGNSAVTVQAEENASADCTLASLDVYPGTLDPAFTPENTTYNVSVGTNVSKLIINAVTTDAAANVRITNNEDLPEGDTSVIVTVNAADGATSLDYIINVSKVAGGPESSVTEGSTDLNDGVQLSSKGKTITIMNPTADVAIPEGFKQGTISIDDQKVQGWVWGAAEQPEYCVVYGMNDKGEINFYRYDMVEKTIQRYFEDPISADAVSNAEYAALQEKLAESEQQSEKRLIIMAILAVVAFALLMAFVYMRVKYQASERMSKAYRRQSLDRRTVNTSGGAAAAGAAGGAGGEQGPEEDDDVRTILKHDYSSEGDNSTESAADETQVIRRHDRKRRARRNRTADADGIMTEEGMLNELETEGFSADDAETAQSAANAAADDLAEALNSAAEDAAEGDDSDVRVD